MSPLALFLFGLGTVPALLVIGWAIGVLDVERGDDK